MSRFKRYERYKDSGVEWIGEIPEHWGVIKLKYVTKLAYGDSLPTENREEEGEVDVFGSNGKVGTHNVANTLSPVIIVGRKGSYGKVTYSDKKCFAIDTTYYIDNRCTKSNIKWLYYSLMVLELDKNSQDTGVPGLSREYAYDKYVPVPTVNEQVAIANFLDQKTAEIDGLIADKEKFIELLQEKRQAIITEAVTKGLNPNVKMKDSGIKWIGEIPEHWEVKRIKYLATVNPSKSEVRHLPPEQEVTFIPMEKIVATGKVDYSITNTVENLIDGYTYFRDGDIIMAKVTPCFENGNIAIVNGLLNGIGFGTTELHVLRCNNKCYNKFLFYYLQSDVFKSKGISEMYGVAGLKRIPTDFVLNYKLGIPDYQEQKQITLYLDTIVDKINTLISDIQTQIDKLKEYRQSIISEAVTGKIKIYNS
jgi:type I restriction enzyme S subunit